jgi:hypothetical protein
MSDIQKIICLYKSRKTIIKLLLLLDYEVQDYIDFSINEIDAMNKNDQLDMLITHKMSPNKKVYVKYHLPEKQKQISKTVLDDTIDDLFRTEKTLTTDDSLIIIMDDEPNDSNISRMNYLYDHDGKMKSPVRRGPYNPEKIEANRAKKRVIQNIKYEERKHETLRRREERTLYNRKYRKHMEDTKEERALATERFWEEVERDRLKREAQEKVTVQRKASARKKIVRCKNGTRRSKRTGNCEPIK